MLATMLWVPTSMSVEAGPIDGGCPSIPAPTISPSGGSYVGSVTVYIYSSTSYPNKRYTTDGSDPRWSPTGRAYMGPFTISPPYSNYVKAAAFDAAGSCSSTVTARWFSLTCSTGNTLNGYKTFDLKKTNDGSSYSRVYDFSYGVESRYQRLSDCSAQSRWLAGAQTDFSWHRSSSAVNDGACSAPASQNNYDFVQITLPGGILFKSITYAQGLQQAYDDSSTWGVGTENLKLCRMPGLAKDGALEFSWETYPIQSSGYYGKQVEVKIAACVGQENGPNLYGCQWAGYWVWVK